MPTILRDGASIHFEVTGTGPPVVLGHSFLTSGLMWAPQIQPLSGRHTVVNVDFRGHGASGPIEGNFDLYDLVRDVLAVLDHLGMDRAVWAGLSLGGMVALRAAVSSPDRVAGLVLLDTHAGAEYTLKKIKYQAMVEFGRLFGIRSLVPQIAQMFFCAHTRRTNPGLVEEWKERFGSVPVATVSYTAAALRRRDSVLEQLGDVDVPALVIVGESDEPTPPALSREIAEALPRASLVEVENAGHLANLEQPEAVNSAIVSFLEDGMG